MLYPTPMFELIVGTPVPSAPLARLSLSLTPKVKMSSTFQAHSESLENCLHSVLFFKGGDELRTEAEVDAELLQRLSSLALAAASFQGHVSKRVASAVAASYAEPNTLALPT